MTNEITIEKEALGIGRFWGVGRVGPGVSRRGERQPGPVTYLHSHHPAARQPARSYAKDRRSERFDVAHNRSGEGGSWPSTQASVNQSQMSRKSELEFQLEAERRHVEDLEQALVDLPREMASPQTHM